MEREPDTMAETLNKAVLKTENLSKSFRHINAVQSLNIDVNEGDVYGFLGPNGAGKTTTIRMILRLIRPSSGRILVYGHDNRADYLEAMKRIGALVEIPAFYPYMSAWRNLEILGRMSGGVERKRIDEVLELVGLFQRRNDEVRGFSQGMRQRLGLGQALLMKSRFVILDEPTNGLDPHGTVDVRNLILHLHRTENVTFMISSHLLYEIEMICNRVGIIREGQLIVQGDVGGLLSAQTGYVVLRASPAEKAEAVVRGLDWCAGIDKMPDGSMNVKADPGRTAEMNAKLVQAGVAVGEISPKKMTLEEYFMKVSKGPSVCQKAPEQER
jgi:ABC-type multidrug transport system ATPase subunit